MKCWITFALLVNILLLGFQGLTENKEVTHCISIESNQVKEDHLDFIAHIDPLLKGFALKNHSTHYHIGYMKWWTKKVSISAASFHVENQINQ